MPTTLTRDDLQHKLIQVISSLSLTDEEDITLETNLQTDLSIIPWTREAYDIAFEIEDQFGIRIFKDRDLAICTRDARRYDRETKGNPNHMTVGWVLEYILQQYSKE